ncbi:GNAT family N-acetyltransferase [Microbacterium esteraromaticum]|uniref:GNAT family N-acetyltransferase n=1 Tax=Microbacterium esteraromaticum TaxID=57043 RepID=A0A7D7W9Q7_9MICO|nr:GNAT family N-acetyltransferase [Microbacterium esteraromaticum]QMU97776.1 GNAT family N-acetyltransferase [Microbacterium esteraromaticum]
MTAVNQNAVPVDPLSEQRLSESGLRYRIVDMDDAADGEAFLRADARGFLDEEPTGAQLTQMRETMRTRRNIGVFDEAAGDWPVATVNSWIAPLTLPGGEVDMWAISSVTVAGTHRRRGIARNLLEGELRAAATAGVPVAGLTVTEATIYGRYGFGPAVPVVRFTIDTARAGWSGRPVTAGRIAYVDKQTLTDDLERLHEATRGTRSGQISGWRGRWMRMSGLSEGDKEAAAVRGVRFTDADGVVQGAMAYTLAEQPGAFRSEMRIRTIITTSDEALRAIWQFVVQHDLVTSAVVDLRPIDDPLPWLVADPRAVKTEVHDHGWLRVLDVPAALTARTYSGPLDLVLRVTDQLGFAHGTWRVRVDAAGRCSVESTDADHDISLGVAELSAVYAGGVPAAQLAAAGRIDGDAAAAAALSAAFSTQPAPHLGIWY